MSPEIVANEVLLPAIACLHRHMVAPQRGQAHGVAGTQIGVAGILIGIVKAHFNNLLAQDGFSDPGVFYFP